MRVQSIILFIKSEHFISVIKNCLDMHLGRLLLQYSIINYVHFCRTIFWLYIIVLDSEDKNMHTAEGILVLCTLSVFIRYAKAGYSYTVGQNTHLQPLRVWV